MRNVLVGLQALTFVGVALTLAYEGWWKLSVAQGLLAIITVLVYS